MLKLLSLLSSVLFLAGCKPAQPSESGTNSITPRGKVVGKWLATLSIGGAEQGRKETESLADTLKGVFLQEMGGSYKLGFALSDQSGSKPRKKDILNQFSILRQDISEFKAKNPQAPTMIVLGLTGHGSNPQMSGAAGVNYQFTIFEGDVRTNTPPEFFTGDELADLVASLGVGEVLLFVDSCESGNLSNSSFMNKYASVLAEETARRNVNIAVITPINEVIGIEALVLERSLRKAFERAISSEGDVATYADFKDEFVRAVCEDDHYYPRSQIKNLAAVQASVLLDDDYLFVGIDPQFYEFIDPKLPLLLTQNGLAKYRSGHLTFPLRSVPSKYVPVSDRTRKICSDRIKSRENLYSLAERYRLKNLEEVEACGKASHPKICIESLRERIRDRRRGIQPTDEPKQPDTGR